MEENMYIVDNFNEMIMIPEPMMDAVCCVKKDGLLENGDTYTYTGTSWVKIQFFGDDNDS
jgi:hypothetical protein